MNRREDAIDTRLYPWADISMAWAELEKVINIDDRNSDPILLQEDISSHLPGMASSRLTNGALRVK